MRGIVLVLMQAVVEIPGGEGVRPFAIGVKEVTWAEFDQYRKAAVGGAFPHGRAAFYPTDGGLLPKELDAPTASATYLRWHAAVEYAAWLSKSSGAYWRLPTETEWTRAGQLSAALHNYEGGMWEYALEFKVPGQYDPIIMNGKDRQRIPPAWWEADPQLPRSLWYLVGAPASAGLRVVRIDGPLDRLAREGAAGKVEVKVLGAGAPRERGLWIPLNVELRNGGDRALDDLEVLLYALTPAGKPHLQDGDLALFPGHPTFTRTWPVLSTSRAETLRAPLKPGERRRFTAEVPCSFDDEDQVNPKAWGGRATQVRFAP